MTLSDHRFQRSPGMLRTYPTLETTWTATNQPGEPRGALTFLRINMSGNSFINHECDFSGETTSVYNQLQPEDRKRIPSCIKGLSEIVGIPIPWRIDFEETSRNFFEAARLDEALTAFEQGFKLNERQSLFLDSASCVESSRAITASEATLYRCLNFSTKVATAGAGRTNTTPFAAWSLWSNSLMIATVGSLLNLP